MLAAPIFDDPGYDQAFKAAASSNDGSAATVRTANAPHMYHTLEPQFITTRSEASALGGGAAVQPTSHDNSALAEKDSAGKSLLCTQHQKNADLNRSTLALLEFGEDELQDMDPDLLTHLKTEEEIN